MGEVCFSLGLIWCSTPENWQAEDKLFSLIAIFQIKRRFKGWGWGRHNHVWRSRIHRIKRNNESHSPNFKTSKLPSFNTNGLKADLWGGLSIFAEVLFVSLVDASALRAANLTVPPSPGNLLTVHLGVCVWVCKDFADGDLFHRYLSGMAWVGLSSCLCIHW